MGVWREEGKVKSKHIARQEEGNINNTNNGSRAGCGPYFAHKENITTNDGGSRQNKLIFL